MTAIAASFTHRALPSSAGFPPHPPTKTFPYAENPFKGFSATYFFSHLKEEDPDLGYHPIPNLDFIKAPASSLSRFDLDYPLISQESLWEGCDIEIVRDDIAPLLPHQIRTKDAVACRYLMSAILASKTSIVLPEDETFRTMLLKQMIALLTRPSGRLILFSAANSDLPIHFQIGTKAKAHSDRDHHLISLPPVIITQIVVKGPIGRSIMQATDFIVLGHELLHILHDDAHINDSLSKITTYSSYDDYFGNYEEKLTVIGVPGRNFVCENSLHYEFNRPQRILYATSSFPCYDGSSPEKLNTERIDGYTRLENAVKLEIDEEITRLLAYGASPSMGLYIALRKRNIRIFRLLLEGGADPNYITREGIPILHMAVLHGFDPAIEMLLNFGADPNQPDFKGATPLYRALFSSYSVGVSLLLSYGAKTVGKYKKFKSPLHAAVMVSDPICTELLLHYRAQLTVSVNRALKALSCSIRLPLEQKRRIFQIKTVISKYLRNIGKG